MFRFLFALLILSSQSYAQKISLIDSIASRQCEKDVFYEDGLFPSQIVRKGGKVIVEDNNIFFTALINYTLQSVDSLLNEQEGVKARSIKSNAQGLYDAYQRADAQVYNFYQVNPEVPFPNLKRLSKMKKMRLANDLDDTSIIYMINEHSDSLSIGIQKEMNRQVVLHPKVKSTFRDYQNSGAYRTWFADKMKQDLDVSVISNALLMVFQENMLLDSTAFRSIEFIIDMMANDFHFTHPELLSSHYQNTSIILYHVARLVAVSDHTVFDDIRKKLVLDIRKQLSVVDNQMERVILISSLYRLNEGRAYQFRWAELEDDMASFYWFKANPLSGSRFWFKKLLSNGKFIQLKYRSEVYCMALIFELQKISNADWNEEGELNMKSGL